MESTAKRPRGRPPKRKRPEDEKTGAFNEKSIDNTKSKKRVVENGSIALLGRYVLKEFNDNDIFLGKIVYYDSGLYRVDYEDGDCEDLDSGELRNMILGDKYFDEDLIERRKKLDLLVSKRSVKNKNDSEKKELNKDEVVDKVETSTLSEVNDEEQFEGDDADSSSDSCEHARDGDAGVGTEALLIPLPQLPPSSGTIGVPEEYVSYLFSVYGFLRSFSTQLFLCPFGLDEFVGSLNSVVANTLLDSIHYALLRALRRHLETHSADSSELPSKCLRSIDWSLLDTLTWPVYLVQYFTVMGYIKGSEWEGFYDHVLVREPYDLPVGRKLMILQILCDDVLESEELRGEIDMRQESEVGTDPDAVVTNPSENGPKRVHPRYSKTSACRNREAMEIIAENQEMKSSSKSNSSGLKGFELASDATYVGDDGNSDDCRLCGMDGTLLCCDGCPSAYHSRCIGVVKMYIPDGPWYCPECTINKMGPTITMGTSLRGAEIFGIDLYGQVFLATCNHLLVFKVSINSEPYLRYYNPIDIPKVLQALFSSEQHIYSYMGICNAILEYWDIPQSIYSTLETIKIDKKDVRIKGDATFSTLPLTPGKDNDKILNNIEADNVRSLHGSSLDSVAVSCPDTSAETVTHTDLLDHQSGVQGFRLLNVKSAMSTGSVSQLADPSDLTRQGLVDRSSATCTSVNSNDRCSVNVNGMYIPEKMSFQRKEGNYAGFGRGDKSLAHGFLFMGSVFKPHAYINHYMQGDFAASAAASLAALSSEEILEAQKSGNARKVISANISLQAKAFSLVASRFFWPTSQRKLVEVPRERCGWCYSCKAMSSSKRGCMLNSAASSATKCAMKIIDGLHVKSEDGSLASIAKFILYMEESLCGLIVGPFLNASHGKQWRRKVELAVTCSVIKVLLLELEENICHIALSGEWGKVVDDCLVEPSVIQSASSTVGTSQKRGPTGKRQRKQFATSEVIVDGRDDKRFSWWRGGMLSVLVFQKAVLPHSMVRKAARQGGARGISGINYGDGSEIPKRSRRLIWRAAVERSKNVSQLALQVRHLDLHVRWSDLVRPEQNNHDAKGPETEASAFRNAVICDKKIVDNKIRYGVAFGNQKHLPSRVMKNIIEIEQCQDGKYKYWFPETRIPLYLIKEYGESMNKVLPLVRKSSNELSDLQKRQLKASRRDIFSYLTCKRDKMEKCACASCQQDVLLGNTVKCSACQGFCHNDCTLRSMYTITCKQCHHTRSRAQIEVHIESPTSPLLLHGGEYPNKPMASKGIQLKGLNQLLSSAGFREGSEVKPATSNSGLAVKTRSKICSWGVIWRKKNSDETGIDFRRENILLKGNSSVHFLRPDCGLCGQPYDSNLMYIHCETCKKWYHADAFELKESKIPDIVGFKCCKCRRIGGPDCPYMDPSRLKEQKQKKRRLRAQKQGQGNMVVDFDFGTISEREECKPTSPKLLTGQVFVPDDDPPLLSRLTVEQIQEQNSEVDLEWNAASGPGLQKLPVRRHLKREEDFDGSFGNNFSHAELSSHFDTNNLMNTNVEPSLPCAEWDVSANGLEGELFEDFNYEGMEFEPQTYFSFTELLASDDGGSGDVSENRENLFCSVSQVGVPERHGEGTFNNQPLELKVSVKPTANALSCGMCSQLEPLPDLSCQICGLVIHSYCSHWDESSPWEDGWRCGNCREWR
ncbi:PHD domain-containing protein/DDT domain-containing protein [Cephalotus follicularis]|uniref:PHD domain-containing protein/DDT domain-containing protein n=1 Tax=Cephalotus follicularis TaxID=3775 RepID=A0A1Q3BUQ1_CEPFO|nr:PHD domain-containing protein/DDT domain-containing protein [Cephalotus follicularis]